MSLRSLSLVYVTLLLLVLHLVLHSSSPASAVVAPSVPQNVVATASTTFANRITVTFTAPASSGDSPIQVYNIILSTGQTINLPPTTNSNTSLINIDGLPAVPVSVAVAARNDDQGVGPASTQTPPVTPIRFTIPDPVTDVTATAGTQQVLVSFTPPTYVGGSAVSITGYTVIASTGQRATGSNSPIMVNGLTNGQAVVFIVVASNIVGPSSPVTTLTPVTPLPPPGSPTGLSAAIKNQEVDVAFNAPVTQNTLAVSGYTVTLTSAQFPVPQTQTINGATPQKVIFTGLTNGLMVTIQVSAMTALGAVSAPATLSAVPSTVPSKPTNVVARIDPTNPQNVLVSFTAGSNGGSAITYYTVTALPGSTQVLGASSPISFPGLAVGTYQFSVRAQNSRGSSDPSISNQIVKQS